MKKKIAILLALILIFNSLVIFAGSPPTSYGGAGTFEDSEAGDIFYGEDPSGDDYDCNNTNASNDYYWSIKNEGKYRNKDTGAALTDNHLPEANFSWSINTTSPEVIRKTGTTNNSIILDLGTICIGDTITFTDKSANGSAAAGNSIQEVYLNINIRQAGYNYNSGQMLNISPGGNVTYTPAKPGIYFVAAQSRSGPYMAWFKTENNAIVSTDIWSVNGAHHKWGTKQFGDITWSGWSHFTGVTFRVEEKDNKKPIADMGFSDTSSNIKYITAGQNVTLIDKSYTLDNETIAGWWVVDRGSPMTYITNANNFFKTYNFATAGTYKFELRKVKDTKNMESDNPVKVLTVVVSPAPQPGNGKVTYEFYKDSISPTNLLGTNEVGISNPYTVVLPDTYGAGLDFKSATYSGEAVIAGGSCQNGTSINIANTTKDLTIQAIYKKETTKPTTNPPSAIISSKNEVVLGDDVNISGAQSFSNNLGGYIDAYYWDIESANIVSDNGSTIRVWYPRTGTYTIELEVEDESGGTDWDEKEIKVIQPAPKAVITYSGNLKENRKITLDGSLSESGSKRFLIDWDRAIWYIQPAQGSGIDINDIKTLNSFTIENGWMKIVGGQQVEILSKKYGQIKAKLKINTFPTWID